jgi:arsenite-transporting ATPase
MGAAAAETPIAAAAAAPAAKGGVADMRWQLPEARDLAPLRYLFFTGKGGVGKTSISCALAVALADAGRKVLLVTTDPASNLEDVFSQEVGATPVPAHGVEGLWLEEVDPTAQAAALRESVVAPYRGVLPADAIAQMEEQLSGSCTVEIAAFDRFAELLAGSETEGFDHIIFDTAPTGHTLRMLELPGAWCTYLDSNTTGTSCLGPLSGLSEKRSLYARAVDILKDPQQCALVLVARPDGLCLDEAARTAQELRGVGIAAQLLIVNALIEHPEDDLARQLQRSQQRALAALPEALEGMPVRGVPLRPFDAVGPEMLRELLSGDGTQVPERSAPDAPALRPLDELVADLVRRRIRLILVMGKGGVGKTTLAVSIARRLAEAGEQVRIATTDPADHLGAFSTDGLEVSHIDEAAELARYQEEVLAEARKAVGSEGLAYIAEDLRSPCTQEIATFRAFAEIVSHAAHETVVIDTAPTGHTLLLLEGAASYGRQIEHAGGKVPESVRSLLPRLHDSSQTEMIVVTLPEDTPVREAERLQHDLDRARMPHGWWIANRCLSLSETRDPILAARAASELPWIERARKLAAGKLAGIPTIPGERTL